MNYNLGNTEKDTLMIDPNITAHILDETAMRRLGFTDHKPDQWYLFHLVGEHTSFNLTIPKGYPEKFKVEVLDELFLQHYDFASIKNDFAKQVGEKVNEMLLWLQEKHVISGYIDGNPATGVH